MATKSYLARVELHHNDDYDQLHELLYDIEYYRTIFLNDGHWHDLQHATYIHTEDSTVQLQTNHLRQVIGSGLNLQSANDTSREQKSYSLTVTESELDGDDFYKSRFYLRRANNKSVLPPGESLI